MNCPFCGAKPSSVDEIINFTEMFNDLFVTSGTISSPLFRCDLERFEELVHIINEISWAYRNETISYISQSSKVCKSVVITTLIEVSGKRQQFEYILSEKHFVNSRLDFLDLLPIDDSEGFNRLRLNALFQEIEEAYYDPSQTLRELLNASNMNILEFREILEETFKLDIKKKFFPLDEVIQDGLLNLLTSSDEWEVYLAAKPFVEESLLGQHL
ncbi:hypothetical protein AAEU28_02010 [Pseudoalteromonas sp. SS15]|uniref:hypothetical protein n=1 Tax=Pseudoalteromonas sp. SS15 TaxID=3139393 RepID=UPI003BA8B2ED